jgi:hypothetical protein
MKDRLKLLDCNRKAILSLPPAALQLWLCYYMNEDDEQESYMALAEIETQMAMGRRSIIKWTKWLVRHGWLRVVPEKSAADKWEARGVEPTPGAYQVRVYRVDDPVKAKFTENLTGAEVSAVQPAPKVSDSGSISCSTLSLSTTTTKGSPAPVGKKDEIKIKTNPVGSVEAKDKSKAKPATVKLKDGTMAPVPEGFWEWSSADRAFFIYGQPTTKEQQAELDDILFAGADWDAFTAKLNETPSPEEAARKKAEMIERSRKRLEPSPLLRLMDEGQ